MSYDEYLDHMSTKFYSISLTLLLFERTSRITLSFAFLIYIRCIN